MLSVNITAFRKNIFSMLDKTIKHNEPVSIHTKEGNAVVISEEDYNGLMETLFVCSVPPQGSQSHEKGTCAHINSGKRSIPESTFI